MGLYDLAQHCVCHSRGSTGVAVPENGRSRDATHDEPVSCDRTLPLEPTSCSRADESRLCARYHIPKAITTAPAKPNQVMAASVSGPFHFRQANVAYCVGFQMPVSDSGAIYTSGRRPKAAEERTRGGWGAENAAHCAMGIWLMRKV